MGLENPAASVTGLTRTRLAGLTSANSAFTLPANAVIVQVYALNNSGNTVTGGLKFGASSGAADIIAALPAVASVIGPPATLLLTNFAAAQQVFIDAVVAWNSANVDIFIIWSQF